jgi:type II secretory pathway component PulF
MPYKFRAYTSEKRVVQGTIDAASESTAEAALYQQGYRSVLRLEEARPGRGLAELVPSLSA